MPRVALLTAFATLLASAGADILHLHDGERYYGDVISESREEIEFRVYADAAGGGVVRRFPRSEVRELVRTAVSRPPEAADAGGDRLEAQDYEQMLREGLELLEDGATDAALAAFQRLASRAPPALVQRLSEQVRRDRGLQLDELMARARFDKAMAEAAKGRFRLRYVSPLESEAMARLLARKTAELLEQVRGGRSLRQWCDEPAAIAAATDDARLLVRDARLAAGMLHARLRFDRAVARPGKLRRELLAERERLARFAAVVSALPGFTAGGAVAELDDPTLDAADELRRQAAEAELERRQAAASQPTSQPLPAAEDP